MMNEFQHTNTFISLVSIEQCVIPTCLFLLNRKKQKGIITYPVIVAAVKPHTHSNPHQCYSIGIE